MLGLYGIILRKKICIDESLETVLKAAFRLRTYKQLSEIMMIFFSNLVDTGCFIFPANGEQTCQTSIITET